MKRLLILTLLILSLLLPSCSQVSDLVPQALAYKTQTAAMEQKIASQDVFAEVQSNIDLVLKLRNDIDTAKMQGKPLSLEDTISGIQRVADSYTRLSAEHPQIRKALLQKVTDVQTLRRQVDNQVVILQKRRADYQMQLNTMQDANVEILRTRREAITQALLYVDKQIALWQDFSNLEANVAAQMTSISQNIDSFLAVIDSSALLFNEGLALLRLQKNLNDAMAIFTQDLPKMQQLTADVEKSWANLDALIGSLVSISGKAPAVPQ